MKRMVRAGLALGMSVCLAVTAMAVPTDVSAKKKAPAPKKITLNKKSVKIQVGKKFTVKVKKITPKKASKKASAFKFKSSKKKIATVTKKGVIKGKKVGSCKVTVTSKTKKKVKATIKVKVIKKVPKPTSAPPVVPTSNVPVVPATTPPAGPGVPTTDAPATNPPGQETNAPATTPPATAPAASATAPAASATAPAASATAPAASATATAPAASATATAPAASATATAPVASATATAPAASATATAPAASATATAPAPVSTTPATDVPIEPGEKEVHNDYTDEDVLCKSFKLDATENYEITANNAVGTAEKVELPLSELPAILDKITNPQGVYDKLNEILTYEKTVNGITTRITTPDESNKTAKVVTVSGSVNDRLNGTFNVSVAKDGSTYTVSATKVETSESVVLTIIDNGNNVMVSGDYHGKAYRAKVMTDKSNVKVYAIDGNKLIGQIEKTDDGYDLDIEKTKVENRDIKVSQKAAVTPNPPTQEPTQDPTEKPTPTPAPTSVPGSMDLSKVEGISGTGASVEGGVIKVSDFEQCGLKLDRGYAVGDRIKVKVTGVFNEGATGFRVMLGGGVGNGDGGVVITAEAGTGAFEFEKEVTVTKAGNATTEPPYFYLSLKGTGYKVNMKNITFTGLSAKYLEPGEIDLSDSASYTLDGSEQTPVTADYNAGTDCLDVTIPTYTGIIFKAPNDGKTYKYAKITYKASAEFNLYLFEGQMGNDGKGQTPAGQKEVQKLQPASVETSVIREGSDIKGAKIVNFGGESLISVKSVVFSDKSFTGEDPTESPSASADASPSASASAPAPAEESESPLPTPVAGSMDLSRVDTDGSTGVSVVNGVLYITESNLKGCGVKLGEVWANDKVKVKVTGEFNDGATGMRFMLGSALGNGDASEAATISAGTGYFEEEIELTATTDNALFLTFKGENDTAPMKNITITGIFITIEPASVEPDPDTPGVESPDVESPDAESSKVDLTNPGAYTVTNQSTVEAEYNTTTNSLDVTVPQGEGITFWAPIEDVLRDAKEYSYVTITYKASAGINYSVFEGEVPESGKGTKNGVLKGSPEIQNTFKFLGTDIKGIKFVNNIPGMQSITLNIISITFSVNQPASAKPEKLEFDVTAAVRDLELIAGDTTTATVAVNITSGEETDKKTIRWISSDPEIADVESASAETTTVIAKSDGEAEISCTVNMGGVRKSSEIITVKVKEKLTATGGKIDGMKTILVGGDSTTLSVTGLETTGETARTTTWSTTDTDIIAVDETTGEVTAKGIGQATVTATVMLEGALGQKLEPITYTETVTVYTSENGNASINWNEEDKCPRITLPGFVGVITKAPGDAVYKYVKITYKASAELNFYLYNENMTEDGKGQGDTGAVSVRSLPATGDEEKTVVYGVSDEFKAECLKGIKIFRFNSSATVDIISMEFAEEMFEGWKRVDTKELSMNDTTCATCLTNAVYGKGTVTYCASPDGSGGGIAYSIKDDESSVDLSKYEKISITASCVDSSVPLCIGVFASKSYWGGGLEGLDNVLDGLYKTSPLEAGKETTYEFNIKTGLEKDKYMATGIQMKYNAWTAEDQPPITASASMTIKSIKLTGKDGEADIVIPISKNREYVYANVSGIVCGDDGCTFEITDLYGGGGLGWHINEDASGFDLSDYKEVRMVATCAEADVPLLGQIFVGENGWSDGLDAGVLSGAYVSSPKEEDEVNEPHTYTFPINQAKLAEELAKKDEGTLPTAIRLKYNKGGDGTGTTGSITVNSITLIPNAPICQIAND